ncbi:hypothetical protein [Geoglobus ahangari]|uniref:hypothetical protein n=1 Tax=Geoglobus ahangari TaxID=113653 RepID=UPI0012EBFFD3|nr:hypothetical protein [Geoglobus ahangari]
MELAHHYSFRVGNMKLIYAIEDFKSKGGNLSKLVVTLLEQYFFGDLDIKTASKDLVELRKIKNGLEEWIRKGKEYFSKVIELEDRMLKKVEEEAAEQEKELVDDLKNLFSEVINEGVESFINTAQKIGREPKDLIYVRLNDWAIRNNISIVEAERLLLKAIPEFESILR